MLIDLEQLSEIEAAGGSVVMMASRHLARAARGPDDYRLVYDEVLSQATRPVILHWLGSAFDPALAGYWGHDEPKAAMATVVDIIAAHVDKVSGIKVSVLDPALEGLLRQKIPSPSKVFAGDDYNYVDLIAGDGRRHSEALLGAFATVPRFASAAFARLDAGDINGFREILTPTVQLSRHVFAAPTQYYKVGVAWLSYLDCHQHNFRMVDGFETGRDLLHLAQLVRSAGEIEDLRLAPLAGSDIERICTGLRQAFLDALEPRYLSDGGPLDSVGGADEVVGAAVGGGIGVDLHTLWFRRWIVGHHLHALFNVMATVALRAAVAAWATGDAEAAAACIARATTYVEAFPAARAYTLALSASFYNSALRPSMMPPLVEVPLSGKMHVEYQRYREQLDALLGVLPGGVVELARAQPSLALAREALLEADLLDSQRHASLVEPVVGAQKSLVQNPRTRDNAVSMLRMIHNRRAARFAKYLRYAENPVEPVVGGDGSR